MLTAGAGPAAGASAAFHAYQGGAWGGYAASGSGFTTITGSWTQPQVSCNTTNDLFAPWVGIDGYGSQSVEQVGVQVDCSSGSPVTSPWYEMYPADPVYWPDQVNPGDQMTGTVTDDGNGSTYTLTLTDDTAGWTETTDQALPGGQGGQDASAEAVVESPTQSYPSFSVSFSGVQVNGQVFDNFAPQALDSGGYSPGPLSNGSFTISQNGGGFLTPRHTVRRVPVDRSHIHY
jgi:hypothetical protein